MSLDDLPMHVALNALAEAYEIAAALPPVEPEKGARPPGKPGSRVPPGVTEILDAEEYATAITEVDEWAEFVAHVLIDEVAGIPRVPDSTPGRLRLAAQWGDELANLEDEMLRYALGLDVVEHLKAMRRFARRSSRVVRTGSACLDVTCAGSYEIVVAGPEAGSELICPVCRERIPHEQWSRWNARWEWVTPRKAADMLGIPVGTVRVWAHRYEWERKGQGRDVRYLTRDVRDRRANPGVSVAS